MPSATLTKGTSPWLRRGALASGFIAALTLAWIGQMPPGTAALGLDATVTTGPTGQLAVAPVGRVVSVSGLRPGSGSLDAKVTVSNETDATLRIRVRARPSIADADRVLHVRFSEAARTLYDGPAGGMREFTAAALTIAPRGSAVLSVKAWLPAGSPGGWLGRGITLPIEYDTKQIGRARR